MVWCSVITTHGIAWRMNAKIYIAEFAIDLKILLERMTNLEWPVKLKEESKILDIRTKLFTLRVVKRWNRLLRDMVDAQNIEY